MQPAILKSRRFLPLPDHTKPGEPSVAVNLSGIDLGAPLGAAPKTTSQQSTSAQVQDATQPHAAEVSITSTASLLAHLEQSLAGKPAVDQKRVEAIAKSLEDGSYRVQPEKIARGLIHSEQTLSRLPLAQI